MASRIPELDWFRLDGGVSWRPDPSHQAQQASFLPALLFGNLLSLPARIQPHHFLGS